MEKGEGKEGEGENGVGKVDIREGNVKKEVGKRVKCVWGR